MSNGNSKLANLTLAAVVTVIAIGVVEVGLRIVQQDSARHYVLPPKQHRVLNPNSTTMPGVSGESNYFTSSDGIRGSEFDRANREYRILAVGGSTTQCAYLDQTETWTLLIAEFLNQAKPAVNTWSGDIGRSGHTARSHVLQIERVIPELPEIDAIVVLAGVNDMTVALQQGDDYVPPVPLSDPDARHKQLLGAFIQVPGPARERRTMYLEAEVPAYKRFALYQLLSDAKRSIEAMTDNTAQDKFGTIYADWRANRRQASRIVEDSPPLAVPLEVYRSYLVEIIELASRYNVRIILMTQPSIWKSEMPQSELDLLWMGGFGDFQNESPSPYYSAEVLASTIEAYNRTMLEVCNDLAVECVDLASAIPRKTEYFYDDVHFTEAGANRVARTIADHFLLRAPFADE